MYRTFKANEVLPQDQDNALDYG